MLKKMSARRCAAFLKALGETGNVTVSAEKACVSRSWVLKRRKEDPVFEAAYRQALAESFERLGTSRCNRVTAKGWGTLDGAELVVRGTSGSGPRRMQIARARPRQWSPKVEKRFLAVLAATCNVKAALAEVGMSKGAAYTHRKRWQGFAERWDAAIEQGALHLEFAIIEAIGNPFSDQAAPEPAEMPPMSAEQMMHCLHMHQYQLAGIGRRPGLQGARPSAEAVWAKVHRACDTLVRARRLDNLEKGRRARELARRGRGGEAAAQKRDAAAAAASASGSRFLPWVA